MARRVTYLLLAVAAMVCGCDQPTGAASQERTGSSVVSRNPESAAPANETADEAPFADAAANKDDPAGSREEDDEPSQDGQGSSEKPDTGNGVKVLVKDREFQAVGPEGALRITYDDFDLLRILNMNPVTPDAPEFMPKWLTDLDGKRIRVRGFMYPPFQETGLRGFVLARDNQICCFGRNPKVYDLVAVTMRDGVTANYIANRPFDVVGVFRIDPAEDDGKLYGLYKIDDALVIDQ